MTLFTKKGCVKCDNVKKAFDLNDMGVNIEEIRSDDFEVLAHLAWHELVEHVEKGALPILVLDDSTHIKYEVPIRRFLEKQLAAQG